MNKYLIIVIIVLLAVIGAEYKQVEKANEKWMTAEANIKNYDAMLASSDNKCAAFQLTIEQLEYFKDSVLQELDATRKKLGVKDKNLKALQSVSSSFSRTDTIVMKDTIFSDSEVEGDTIVGDGWYSLRLSFWYPFSIAVKPEFRSEKHIVVSTRRETVNPPKKFFLLRWFQKRHTILNVDVVEKNPYVRDETSRYIEILK